MMKIEDSRSGSESGSGSISQRHGSADLDPDPHKNVMDPQHCSTLNSLKARRRADLLSTGRSGPGERRLVLRSSIDFRRCLSPCSGRTERPSRSVSALEPGRLGPLPPTAAAAVDFLPETARGR